MTWSIFCFYVFLPFRPRENRPRHGKYLTANGRIEGEVNVGIDGFIGYGLMANTSEYCMSRIF